MPRRLATPTSSLSVPKFAVAGTPAIEAVPDLLMLPRANGVPALGRALIPDHVICDFVAPPPLALSCVRTVVVIVLAVTEMGDCKVNAVDEPAILVTVAVTAAEVSNTNPGGALKMMVPVPTSRLLA